MEIKFNPVEVSDREWACELMQNSNLRGCEYTFGNNYMWSPVYDIQIARYKNFYLVRSKYGYLLPAGHGDIVQVTEALLEYTCGKLRYTNADKESTQLLHGIYGDKVQVSTDRDRYDYVYEYVTLSELAGRKLHSKRNHLHRFRECNWSYEPITADNIEEVAAMHNRWCDEKNIYSDKEKLAEAGAVIRGLDKFFELGLVGGTIRVDGEIHAYTFGEPLCGCSGDTFVIHVEKAFSQVQGTYAAINNEFVRRACGNYSYINREEDMGAENLRKAKMSYCPAYMVEKYCVNFV